MRRIRGGGGGGGEGIGPSLGDGVRATVAPAIIATREGTNCGPPAPTAAGSDGHDELQLKIQCSYKGSVWVPAFGSTPASDRKIYILLRNSRGIGPFDHLQKVNQ